MKRLLILIGFLSGLTGLHAQQSSDYGIFLGLTGEHRHTILPIPKIGSLKPAFGGFYRYNLNPRYALRAGINYGIGTTPEEATLNHTPLEKADFYGLFEFNFLPLSPRKDRIKVSTYIGTGVAYYKSFVVPFHTGVKYNATDELTLGVEWNLRRGFRQDPTDPDTGYRLFRLTEWNSFFGVTIGYKVIKTCRTCPFYETNRKYKK
jgi:hypothetical protein